jgi:hypothetical protein
MPGDEGIAPHQSAGGSRRVRNQPYEPPARFDLDQNTCFSEGGIVGLRGAGPPSVRRKIRFVVALQEEGCGFSFSYSLRIMFLAGSS